MSVTTFSTLSLENAFAEAEGRASLHSHSPRPRRPVVRHQRGPAVEGEELLREHDEVGYGADRHEKVWLVLSGHAVFTVDGEEIDAPSGTVVHVPAAESKRSAVAGSPVRRCSASADVRARRIATRPARRSRISSR